MSLAGRDLSPPPPPVTLPLPFLSSRGLPIPLLFRLELGFPKPTLSYPIAAEARKFIGCVEELKRLRTIRTDTKLNSYVSRLILISSGDFAVNGNRDIDKLSAILIGYELCSFQNLITKFLLF